MSVTKCARLAPAQPVGLVPFAGIGNAPRGQEDVSRAAAALCLQMHRGDTIVAALEGGEAGGCGGIDAVHKAAGYSAATPALEYGVDRMPARMPAPADEDRRNRAAACCGRPHDRGTDRRVDERAVKEEPHRADGVSAD